MSKKPKVPYPVCEYYIDEENKVIWLIGSFMRAMCLRGRREDLVPGYTIKLAVASYINELKVKHYDQAKED